LKRILMGRGGEGRVEKKDGGGFINSGLTVPPVWLKKVTLNVSLSMFLHAVHLL
jgi:hypothetical protein